MSVGVSVIGRDGAGGTALRLTLVCNFSLFTAHCLPVQLICLAISIYTPLVARILRYCDG